MYRLHDTLFCLVLLASLSACNLQSDKQSKHQQPKEEQEKQITSGTPAHKYPVLAYGEFMHATADKENGAAEPAMLPGLELTKNEETVEVNNCEQFLEKIKDHDVGEGANNMRILADYQPCIAGSIFKRGAPAANSYYNGNFSSTIYQSLDLKSFPSSLHNRVSNNQNTLSTLGFRVSTQTDKTLTIKTEGWLYQFDLLARGDFTHNGSEDLLVQFLDQATEGNYYSLDSLVLSRSANDALWKAVDGVRIIRSVGKASSQ